jgi:hypothetical protein
MDDPVNQWKTIYGNLTPNEKTRLTCAMGGKETVLKVFNRARVTSTYNAWLHLTALRDFIQSIVNEIEEDTA